MKIDLIINSIIKNKKHAKQLIDYIEKGDLVLVKRDWATSMENLEQSVVKIIERRFEKLYGP